MSRTRATRRANTVKKTTSRKKRFNDCSVCSNKLTPSGEVKDCCRCLTAKGYNFNHPDYIFGLKKKDAAWWLAQI